VHIVDLSQIVCRKAVYSGQINMCRSAPRGENGQLSFRKFIF